VLKVYRSMFPPGKIHRIKLGTNLAMSSNGSGFVNSAIAINSVASTADFASLASVFDEYFVVSVTAHYMPISRYSFQLFAPGSSVSASLPMQVVCLQHDSAPYSTTSTMANHGTCVIRNSGDPFTTVWRNIESPKTPTVVNPTTTLIATQGWCQTNSTAAPGYTGAIQFLTDQSSPPLLVASYRVGSFLVVYDVLWKVRE